MVVYAVTWEGFIGCLYVQNVWNFQGETKATTLVLQNNKSTSYMEIQSFCWGRFQVEF